MNQILLQVLLNLFDKSGPEIEAMAAEIDEDDAEASFSVRQRVRVCKTVLLLQDSHVDDARHVNFVSGNGVMIS